MTDEELLVAVYLVELQIQLRDAQTTNLVESNHTAPDIEDSHGDHQECIASPITPSIHTEIDESPPASPLLPSLPASPDTEMTAWDILSKFEFDNTDTQLREYMAIEMEDHAKAYELWRDHIAELRRLQAEDLLIQQWVVANAYHGAWHDTQQQQQKWSPVSPPSP
jgi:hypothetical protein